LPTNASGQCTVIVNSSVAGSSTVNAFAVVTVAGVQIEVATNGYGAHDVSNVKTWVAPPPPPYVPRADIAVTKAATPAVVLPLGGGSAPIVYNLVVINNGPDPAANVKVADSAPVDVAFVSATTSAGSCVTTALALDCTVASLASGASVAITVNATVNQTGTKTNVVTVTTTTPETNASNNTAQAPTVVTAPVTPPAVKPKPKPLPEVCDTLTAGPKTVAVTGRVQRIAVRVAEGAKAVAGARVRLTGPGISRTVRTGKNGKLVVAFKPSKPGIVKVAIVGAKACNSQRVGVIGQYEPPVTG
jgi:uncharacterized repeat protein (TIGR01451 family)